MVDAESWLHKDHGSWRFQGQQEQSLNLVPTKDGRSIYSGCLRNCLSASWLQELSIFPCSSSGSYFVNTMSLHLWSQLTAPRVKVLKGRSIRNLIQEFWIFCEFSYSQWKLLLSNIKESIFKKIISLCLHCSNGDKGIKTLT